MENQYESVNNKKQNVSSSQSIFPPNSDSPPKSTSSALPPTYAHPAQSPPLSGMPSPQHSQPLKPGVVCPQPSALPPGGQPNNPQQAVFYPGPPVPNYQPPLSPQQQQQQVVILSNQPVVVVSSPPVPMVGAIALSCIVYWCCGLVCGGIAYALAKAGQGAAAAGDSRGAIQMRNASFGVSIAGIVTGIIIIACAAAMNSSAPYQQSLYNNCYNNYTKEYYYCK